MAKYKKKRARELQPDRFRDTTMGFFDRLGDTLEGKGRTILYALGGVLLAGILVVVFVKWSHKKNDEARQAIGRAITITKAPVMTTPVAGNTELTFSSEVERAQRRSPSLRKWLPSTAILTGPNPAILLLRIDWFSIVQRV